MYKQTKKHQNSNSVSQRRSFQKGINLKDNREVSDSNEIIQKKITGVHNKGCGCASCSGTMKTIQKKSIKSGENILQLKPCDECGKAKGHLSGCSRHKHNRSNTGKGTHKLGGSHDDGSGYQKRGSGGDRHEKGRRAAQKAREKKKRR